jgi:hypothetical protein
MSITENKSQQDGLTIFMMVKTMPEWLSFPVAQRFEYFNRYMSPILKKYEDEVRCRIFDTEFFSTRVTDLWMWEANSRHAYEMVVEELRETPLWDRYFAIVEILVGVENAYARNYGREAVSA